MTLVLLTLLWTFCSLNLILPMHPLSLGIMVFILAMTTCFLIALSSPWYAYMLFFIFIGGMLVMFAYIASLSPNSTFSLNHQTGMIFVVPTMFLIMTTYSQTPNSLQTINTTLNAQNNNMQSFNFLYSITGANTLILLACILLLTLVVVVKLTKPSSGPLRPFITSNI
uniref:NADH-ubiquinone oxidoreductase chain 6 n=1 Tax=Mutela dubia TaxID=152234 RepID=A0A1X9JI66_9BIVA|nr:NADH dehydrogenase subunit 6 [Mutela dubia]AQT38519.1 NADH dehydrogenase subunit 6 [Mutela dubia]